MPVEEFPCTWQSWLHPSYDVNPWFSSPNPGAKPWSAPNGIKLALTIDLSISYEIVAMAFSRPLSFLAKF